MKIAYFDCFSGISGDMTLGAMVDLGVPLAWLTAQLNRLGIAGYELKAETVSPNGIQATRVQVIIEETHHHRTFAFIRDLIQRADLAEPVKSDSLAVFERLASAEAKIHGCDPDEVHFHEVGALDAIVDIVGSCLAKHYLGIDTIIASPLPLGRGFVRCAHGVLPVPAPAVLEILKAVPVYSGSQEKELVTPTGASILSALAARFGPMPLMAITAIGYGAGTHELKDQPNVLRVILGDSSAEQTTTPNHGGSEMLMVVETTIDDMNPEFYGHLMDRLFSDGALDVCWIPVQMKKNRPGILVQVLCPPDRQADVTTRILSETTSLGVRTHAVQRVSLAREAVAVQTPYGKVAAKKVIEGDGSSRIVPEFDSCRRIALDQGLPLRRVYDAASSAAAAATVNGRVSLDKQ